MPRLAVVYDSNLYRSLSADAFEQLREGEANCSVLGYANYFVAFELLSHLADIGDPSFGPGLAAIKRLWSHCTRYDGSREVLQFVADSEAQLAYALFGHRASSRAQENHVHAATIGEICNATNPALWSTRCRQVLDLLTAHVREVESRFVDDLWEIVKSLNPEAKLWSDVVRSTTLREGLLERIRRDEASDHVAGAIVAKAANDAGIALEPHELTAKLPYVRAHFPLPIAFYNRLVRRLIEQGPDMTKKHRANSIWDLQVAFSVGRGARLGVLPLWLISDDRDLLNAAEEAEARWHVRSSREYKALLDAGYSSFQEELDIEPLPAEPPAA